MQSKIIQNVRNNEPRIHCITNFVSVNDCANVLLACGAAPIMADDVAEVCEVTSISDALVLNTGTLKSSAIPSMLVSGKRANELGIPVILDPVGVGVSKFRTDHVNQLLANVRCTVIRGNASEIKALSVGQENVSGVDSNRKDMTTPDSLAEVIEMSQYLSNKTGAIIAISGAIDVIVKGSLAHVVYNGHPLMSKITGTGCMLSAVMGSFCAANQEEMMKATTIATSMFGIAGEKAASKLANVQGGLGTFKQYFMDEISMLTDLDVEGGMKLEIR